MKAVDSVVALRNRKERFPVISLHPDHHYIFSVQINGSRIHHRVNAETLHEIGIPLRIKVIPPVNRRKFPGQHRINVSVIDAVIVITLLIFSGNKLIHFCLFHIILFM